MKIKNAIKTISLTFICLLAFEMANAQDSTKVAQANEVLSLNKIRLSLLGVTYEREQKVGKLTSIYVAGGGEGVFLYEYHFDGYYSETKSYFNITPTINLGIRRYYNFEQRNKKGKKTVNNAANYYGLDISAYFAPLLKNNYTGNGQVGITPQWGYQRSVGKSINFDLMLGPTLILTEAKQTLSFNARIGFSFIL